MSSYSTSPTKFRRCSSVALSPTSSVSPLRSSIGRRWSFDSTREGYVKDLRKYQSSSSNSRDESYPLMLSEKQKSGKKKKSSSSSECSPSSSRRVNYGRGHSMDVSSFAVPEDFELTQSSLSVFPHSEAPSVSRSIEDHRPLLSSLRQRSSSLPRILPPIFDDEAVVPHLGSSSNHHHRKSIAGALLSTSPSSTMGMAANHHSQGGNSSTLVREMQKFVCRQASDVSNLLPLPLPTKYSLIIKEEDDEDLESVWEFLSLPQAVFALSNLAKVHGSSLAMKQVAPQLFEDIVRTLDNNKGAQEHPHHHPHIQSNTTKGSSSSAKNRSLDIQNRISNSPFCSQSLRVECLSFMSSSAPNPFLSQGLCLNEDLNVKAINFRTSPESQQIVSCKFDRMTASTVGPILGDVYSFIFNCIDPDALRRGDLDIRELLSAYHSSLSNCAGLLKLSIEGLQDPDAFHEVFSRNVRPGFFIAFLLSTKRSGLHDKNEAKAKMELFLEEIHKSL